MDNIYIHDKNVKFPKNDFEHMHKSEKVHNYTYDKNFMYRLTGFKNKFIQFLFKLMLIILVQPVCIIRYALRIKGKENIKKYFKISKSKSMISICNHTVEWDTIFVSISRYFHFPEFPVTKETFILQRVYGHHDAPFQNGVRRMPL